MSEIKLKPCPLCGRSDIKTETWASGGRMYMVKCNNQTMIDDVLREAERWIKCERITPTGAIFSRDFEPRIRMTDAQIEREVHER